MPQMMPLLWLSHFMMMIILLILMNLSFHNPFPSSNSFTQPKKFLTTIDFKHLLLF